MNSRTSAFLQLHIAIFLFGFTAILGRLIELHGITIVWYRLLLTIISLCFFPGLVKKLFSLPRKAVLKIMGIGILVATHWVFFYAAIKYSNVSVTLSVLASTALFTSMIEPLVFKRKIRISEVLLGGMVILGFFFIFRFGGYYLTGIFLAVFSAFFAAMFGVLNKTIVQTYDVRVITLLEFVSGILFLTLIFPIYLHFFPETQLTPAPMDWLWLIILALLCTTVAYMLALNALKEVTAFTVALTINLEPIYGILMAYFFFREDKELNPGFYLGATIILLAIFLHPMIRKMMRKRGIDPG
jgi:drug/metabolite transporter (DMT)-like permease